MSAMNKRVAFLHFVRETELNCSLKLVQLPPAAKVLEFGSGDGFLARLLAQKGFEVTAVDIAPRYPQQYPVIKIGTPELPFADKSFDLIFSSNALEHIRDLSATLSELRRVLKTTGAAIFTMPTPAWRFYTLLNLPLRIALSMMSKRQPLYYTSGLVNRKVLQGVANTQRRRKSVLIRGLAYALRPHGEYPSALHELVTFSPKHWKCVFEQNKFRLMDVLPLPLVYGDMLFPWRGVRLRKKLANKYTSSCMAYYVLNCESLKIDYPVESE